MKFDGDTLNVVGLEKLLKALKVSEPPRARVGIIGSKAGAHVAKDGKSAGKAQPTNALIGAVHEFGSPSRGIPQRSFLRIPIASRLSSEMDRAGAFDKETMKEVIKTGTVKPWLKKVAIIAEAIVSEAFDTGGFGQWKAWQTPGYTNNTGQLLVDTTQLRNSITSEVK